MSLRERIYDAVLNRGKPDVQAENRREGYRPFLDDDAHIDTISPPEDDLEHYWQQYESCPFVRVPIRIYAEDITEPGYRIEADDEALVDELESWLEGAAIVGGEDGHDFGELLHQDIVQKEVRGTTLVECVPTDENPDRLFGFRLINVSTVSAYTYENKPILIRPDDAEHDDVHLTSDGQAAAYGQWDDDALAGPFVGNDPIYLAQDDVIKRTQAGDTSDIFGTSSIEPVSKEIDELEAMLASTKEAVHSKGFPHWIFKLGEPNGDAQNPRAGIWPDDKMQAYRDSHKQGNWEVSQKDFVPGDVDVDVISSDVPEIQELLDWYVETILSAMPVPKFKIGHADSVNRDVTKTQQAQYERKITSERRRLERDYTPVLRRKAREWDYSDEAIESIELTISEPRESNPLARDEFDPEAFNEFARGVKAIAPGGQADLVVEPDEVREMLGLGPRSDDESELAADDPLPETDEASKETEAQIQAQFAELYDEALIEPEADVEAPTEMSGAD
jgi:hypothetical protein